MSFSNDWTVSNNPADHSKFKDQPSFVRKLRTDLADRLANMIYGFTTSETAEGFKKLLFNNQGSNPSTPTDAFVLFAKDASAKSELHALNEDGTVTQLTLLGKLLISALDIGSAARGDLLVRGASVFGRLGIGTNGQILKSDGTDPVWGAEFSPTADNALSGSVLQVVHAETSSHISGSTAIPADDTVPTWAEGDDTTVVATITPKRSDSILIAIVHGVIGGGASQGQRALTLFLDPSGTDPAIQVAAESDGMVGGSTDHLSMIHKRVSGVTSELNFKLRFGSSTGTQELNNYAAATDYGGSMNFTSITVFEIKA